MKSSLNRFSSLLFRPTINSTRAFKLDMSAYQKSHFKVFVTQPIPNEALQILQSNHIDASINTKIPLKRDELLKGVQGVDALFCTLNEKIDKELLETAGSKLKVTSKTKI